MAMLEMVMIETVVDKLTPTPETTNHNLSVLRTFLKPTEDASLGCWNLEKRSGSMKSASVKACERRRMVTIAVVRGPEMARRMSAMQRFILNFKYKKNQTA